MRAAGDGFKMKTTNETLKATVQGITANYIQLQPRKYSYSARVARL